MLAALRSLFEGAAAPARTGPSGLAALWTLFAPVTVTPVAPPAGGGIGSSQRAAPTPQEIRAAHQAALAAVRLQQPASGEPPDGTIDLIAAKSEGAKASPDIGIPVTEFKAFGQIELSVQPMKGMEFAASLAEQAAAQMAQTAIDKARSNRNRIAILTALLMAD